MNSSSSSSGKKIEKKKTKHAQNFPSFFFFSHSLAHNKLSQTAVGNGPSTITATFADSRTASTTATGVVNVAAVAINTPTTTILNPSQTLQLTATITPANALDQALVWTSSAPSVLAVDSATGLVTAGGSQGTATITATSVDGSIASTPLTLYVGSLTISPVNPTVTTRGGPVQLTVTAYPTSTVTWTSSDPLRITVDSTGLLTAAGGQNGPSVITATLADGRTITTTATAVINVVSVAINAPGTTILNPLQALQLTATISPANALTQTLVWSSSAPSVISVDASTGVVTAGASQGTANIVATAVDGSIASTALVMYVGVITISPSNPTVYTAAAVQLTPTIYPSTTVTAWASSNTALATVSATGLVTAVDNGSGTVISLTTADGRTANTTVTTVVSVASVSIVQPR